MLAVMVACAVPLVAAATWCYFNHSYNRHLKYMAALHSFQGGGASTKGSPRAKSTKRFSFHELSYATSGFADNRVLGSGGYGFVYKGTLPNGTQIAVKRSAKGSSQGAAEFNMELELLSRVHHKNLLALLGYCVHNREELLVYEYMQHGTVRENIASANKTPMSFAQRIDIALGSARGLLYLHEFSSPPIVHRDVKSTNILLDSKMVAKLADFGLCKIADDKSIHSTIVKGTQGYLDPEYFRTKQITTKSDVYSFGVVLLELMTGMPPIDKNKTVVAEVKKAFKAHGHVASLVDPRMGPYPLLLLERVCALGLHCVAQESENRPTMRIVVGLLEEVEAALQNSNDALERLVSIPLEGMDSDYSMSSSPTNSYSSHVLSIGSSPSSATSSQKRRSFSSEFNFITLSRTTGS